MASMRFNARLDTPHHGPPHPFKDAGAVVDSLIGIHSVMVKCLFVVNSSCVHKGVCVSPQVKLERIQMWRAWRPCSGPSSTYPSVMIGVIENISHSTAKICRSTIMHFFSYNLQIRCFRASIDMDILFLSWHMELVPSVCRHLSVTFCINIILYTVSQRTRHKFGAHGVRTASLIRI
jgi:hypothetical protein